MVEKRLEQHVALLLLVSRVVELLVRGVDARHGAPEVAPPPRQHAGLHDLEGVQVSGAEEDVVRDLVDPARHGGSVCHGVGQRGISSNRWCSGTLQHGEMEKLRYINSQITIGYTDCSRKLQENYDLEIEMEAIESKRTNE
jgi:hypothetical protein